MANRNPPKHQQASNVKNMKSDIMALSEMKSMFSGMRQKASRGKSTGAAKAMTSEASFPYEESLVAKPCMRTPKYVEKITTKDKSRKDHRFSVCTVQPCSQMEATSSNTQPAAYMSKMSS